MPVHYLFFNFVIFPYLMVNPYISHSYMTYWMKDEEEKGKRWMRMEEEEGERGEEEGITQS